MKYFNKNNLNQFITIGFFIILAVYFVNNRDALKELLSITWWVIALLIVLKAVRIFITGLFTKFTLDAFDKHMTIRETNYLSLLSSLGNFFGPILGGASIRAVYLKKWHKFEYSKFISTIYGFYIVSFMANALIGLALLGYMRINQGVVDGMGFVAMVFGVIFFGNLILIVVPPKWLKGVVNRIGVMPKRLRRIILMMSDGWETMRNNMPLLIKLTLLNFLVFGIVVVESSLLYGQFTQEFTIESVVLYAALGAMSTLVSFTPGAIGIKEGIFVFSSSIIALDSTQIIQMATIDRSATFILLFVTFVLIKITSLDKKFLESSPDESNIQAK